MSKNFLGVIIWVFALQITIFTFNPELSLFSRNGLLALVSSFGMFAVAFVFFSQILRHANNMTKLSILFIVLLTSTIMGSQTSAMLVNDLSQNSQLIMILSLAYSLGFAAVIATSYWLAKHWQNSELQPG